MRIFWLWHRVNTDFTTSGTGTVTRCARSSPLVKRSPAKKYLLLKSRAGLAIPPGFWPPPGKRSQNWDGSRDILSWSKSCLQHGSGTKSIRKVIRRKEVGIVCAEGRFE